jgi:hypothetical protein
MNSEKNNVDLSFRSYDDNSHNTDINVNINGENINEAKLKKLLNTWLLAIDSKLTVS